MSPFGPWIGEINGDETNPRRWPSRDRGSGIALDNPNIVEGERFALQNQRTDARPVNLYADAGPVSVVSSAKRASA